MSYTPPVLLREPSLAYAQRAVASFTPPILPQEPNVVQPMQMVGTPQVQYTTPITTDPPELVVQGLGVLPVATHVADAPQAMYAQQAVSRTPAVLSQGPWSL